MANLLWLPKRFLISGATHIWNCYLECKKWQIKEIHSKCYRLHLQSNKLGGFYSFPPYQIRLLHLKGSWSLPETIWARGDICLERRDRQSQKITKFTFYWEISTLILPNFKQWRCKCRLLLCFFCTNRQIYTYDQIYNNFPKALCFMVIVGIVNNLTFVPKECGSTYTSLMGNWKKWELQEMMFNGKLKGLEIARRDGIMVHRLQSRALAKQYIWLFCPFFCPFVLLRMIHNALWRNRWCRSHDTFIPLGAKLWYKTTRESVHTFTILFIILKRINQVP